MPCNPSTPPVSPAPWDDTYTLSRYYDNKALLPWYQISNRMGRLAPTTSAPFIDIMSDVKVRSKLTSFSSWTLFCQICQNLTIHPQQVTSILNMYHSTLTKHQNNGNDIYLLIPLVRQLSFVQFYSTNVYKFGEWHRLWTNFICS